MRHLVLVNFVVANNCGPAPILALCRLGLQPSIALAGGREIKFPQNTLGISARDLRTAIELQRTLTRAVEDVFWAERFTGQFFVGIGRYYLVE